MAKIKYWIGLTLSLSVIFTSYSQSKISVGFHAGRASLVPETIETTDQLQNFNAKGIGGVNMLIYGRYYLNPNWSIRAGGGIIGYGSGHTYDIATTRTGFRGVQPQIIASFDYHLLFGTSDFGLIFSAGMNTSRAHQYNDRTISSQEGHPLTYVRELNEDGIIINAGVLGHDVNYLYSRQKTLLHLRPEVTLFKNFGRHKLMTSFIYGYSLKRPVLIIDYNSISHKENFYSAKHRFSGSFTAFQLGYELSF